MTMTADEKRHVTNAWLCRTDLGRWVGDDGAALMLALHDEWSATAREAFRQFRVEVLGESIPREITAYAFMMRFTAPERSAIRAATAVNEDLADLYDRQRAAQTINLDDAEVAGGLALLEGAGILAEGRAAEILA